MSRSAVEAVNMRLELHGVMEPLKVVEGAVPQPPPNGFVLKVGFVFHT